MKTLLISSICLALTIKLYSQQLNKYQEDFIELSEIIHKSYPLSESTDSILLSLEPQYVAQLKTCDNNDEFKILSQKYMAKLNDGHSKIECYQPFTRKGRHSVKFNFINEKLYIANYPNSIPKHFIGKQIEAINGIKIPEIVERAKTYISADNNVALRNYLRYLLNQVTFYDYIGMDANLELKLELIDGSSLCWVRDFDKKTMYMSNGDSKYIIDTENIEYYNKQENDLTGWSDELFEYEILKEHNVCYFNFRECFDIQWLNDNPGAFDPIPNWLTKIIWYFRGGDFTDFLSEMFSKIEEERVDNLIIDLRKNVGGTSILGYQLLDYLMDIDTIKDYSESLILSELLKEKHPDYFNKIVKKEEVNQDSLPILLESYNNSSAVDEYLRDEKSNYYQTKPEKQFKGNVFVMVGNKTFSSAAMIAVLLADNNLATVVGNPIGIGASHYGEILNFKLTNSNVEGSISCKKFYRPAKNNQTQELSIDIKIANSQSNIFNGRDYEFEQMLNKYLPNIK